MVVDDQTMIPEALNRHPDPQCAFDEGAYLAAGEATDATQEWPRISMVVINFNYGRYLETALRSILLQRYPNLELVVIDGGSTDESLAIIRHYESCLTHWESEADRGQSHAINKGFVRCTGDVINWLCSDDLLLPGALEAVGRHFRDPTVRWLVGGCRNVFLEQAKQVDEWPSIADVWHIPVKNPIPQPSCFYRRALIQRQHLVREDLHYSMDRELWAYLLTQAGAATVIPDVLSLYRWTGHNKTSLRGPESARELHQVISSYTRDRVSLSFWYMWLRFPIQRRLRATRGVEAKMLRRLDRLYRYLAARCYGRDAVDAMDWRFLLPRRS